MMTDGITLRIGIASKEDMRERTLAIARGIVVPVDSDPTVWFASIESLAQVLSTKNRMLLELIRKAKPASMKQLAELSGRSEGNLSRTLHTLARYKLVRLTQENGKKVPEVPYGKLSFELPLAA